MIDILASTAPDVVSTLVERTESAPKVQQILSVSLAPAFLLSGIGGIMNVMMSRMIWISNRLDRIEARAEDNKSPLDLGEQEWLLARRRLAQGAMMFSTGAAGAISVVITLLFLSAYIEPKIGTLIVFAWVLTMVLLIVGLGFFFRETRLAARGHAGSWSPRARGSRKAEP